MRVRQHVGEGAVICIVLGHVRGIALRHVNFSHRVVNGLAGFILRQVLPLIAPVVGGGKHHRVAKRLAIGIQLHRHRCRADAVLVVRVNPSLEHVHAGRSDLVLVGQRVGEGTVCRVVLRHRRSVATRHVNLAHGIGDRLAVSVLLKIGPLILPAIGSGKLDRITNRRAVGVQLHLHGCRTDAVLVIGVVPCLRNLDGRLLRAGLLRVRQRVGVVAVRVLGEFDGSRIAFGRADLLDAVLDGGAGYLRRQISPRTLPAVIGRKRQRIAVHCNLFATGYLLIQLHGDGVMIACVVGAIGILPRLLYAHAYLGGIVLVGQRVGEGAGAFNKSAGDGGLVALDVFHLCHRVGDGLAGILFHQVRPGGRPAVICGKRLLAAGNHLAVGKQLHRHGSRADVVGVVRVIPDLMHAHAGLGDLMRVRQRKRVIAGGILARDDCAGIASHGNLVDGIRVRAVVTPHGQVFERGRPVIAGRKRLRANDLLRPTVHAAH